MPGYNGSGTYQRFRSWEADAAAGVKIRADYHDDEDDGFAAGLSNAICRDGQSTVTQNIPFNAKKITNLGAPVDPTDAATKQYVDALNTFPGGIALPGAGTGAQPPSTIGWTNAAIDLSWVGRGTGFITAGSAPHIALNDKGDGSGTDVFRINDQGNAILNKDWSIQSYKTDDWTKIKVKMEIKPGTGASNNVFTLSFYDNVGTQYGAAVVAPGVNYGFTDGICLRLEGLGGDAGNGGSNIALNKPNDAAAAGLMLTQANLKRWYTYISGTLGDLTFQRYNNAGAYIDQPLTITRANYSPHSVAEISVRAVITATACIQTYDTNASLIVNALGCVNVTQFTGPGSNCGLLTRNIVGGTANHHQIMYYNTATGSITTNGSTTAFNTTSDSRTKDNARDATGPEARSLVDAIKVIVFDPVEPVDQPEGHRHARDLATVEDVAPPDNIVFMGIAAQQAYGVYPQAVTPPDTAMPGYKAGAKFGEEGFFPWQLDYSKFVPMLVANTQDNSARLDALEARLAQLEAA